MSVQSITKNISNAVGDFAVLRQQAKKARQEKLTWETVRKKLLAEAADWIRDDEDAQQIIEDVFSEEDESLMVDGDGKPTPEAIRLKSMRMIEPHAKLIHHGGNTFAAVVKDPKNFLLEPPLVYSDSVDTLVGKVARLHLAKTGETLPPTEIRNLLSYWRTYAEPIDYPPTLGPAGDSTWALHRPRVLPDPECAIPHFQAILDRLSDPEAFGAFWWSALMDEHRGRQTLWLYGPRGEDGKSVLLNLLGTELFGPSMEVISASMFTGERRFLFASFEHARLVVYPDANSTSVLQREEFKMICSGGRDQVNIERKGEMPYKGRIRAQMAVASNHEPSIENTNHSRSRILLISISPLTDVKDPRIEEKLLPELPGFLAFCQAAYNKVCPDHSTILVNDTVQRHVDRLAAESDDRWHNLVDRYFVIDEDLHLPAAELEKVCRKEEHLDQFDYERFKQFLKREYRIERANGSSGQPRRYPGIGRRGARPTPAPEAQQADF